MKFKNLIALLICFSLIFSQSAFAARIGQGKSYGMQRNTTSYSQQAPRGSTTAGQNTNNGNQRPGMGAGTAAVLGAAAGAAGGYMLGKSMNNNQNASATQSARPQSNIPWGTIAILAILLCVGLMMFRKSRTNPAGLSTNPNLNTANNPNQFNIPTINRSGSSQYTQTQPAQANTPQSAQVPAAAAPNMLERMPDGVETVYFLRQAKGMFLHIQSMNNADNVGEVEKYMTPALYQEIKSSINDNKYMADFSNLDCQLLNSEVVNSQLIASVKFFGLVSEEPNQPPAPFSEIWNFVKTDLTNSGKWLVAGIQQEVLA